jgi:hypothetical protein
MNELIKRYSSGRNVLLFLVGANLLYVLMLFVTIPQVMAFSGGMKLFDLMPAGYDLEYAKSLLQQLGEEGRNLYLTRQLPVDLFYPLLSAIAYTLLMAWLFKRLNFIDKPVFWLCLIPFMAGLFDYLENISIILMITSYPEVSGLLAHFANAFTVIKSMLSVLFFGILIIALPVFLIKLIIARIKTK